MSLTNKGKQQILREQMHAMFPYFIKIDWRNGTVSRFVNTDEDMDFDEYDAETGTYNTESYQGYTFSLTLPESTDKGYGTGSLKLSRLNDNENMVALLRNLENGKLPIIEITGSIIYSEGQTIDELEVIYDSEYYLSNPTWGDDTDITFSVKTDEGLDVQMPCDTLNEMTCAGVL